MEVVVIPEIRINVRQAKKQQAGNHPIYREVREGMWVYGDITVSNGRNEFKIETKSRPKHLNVWVDEFPSHCGGCASVLLEPTRIHDDGFVIRVFVSEGYAVIHWKYEAQD